MVTWDEARILREQAWREQWDKRVTHIDAGRLTCPNCEVSFEATSEVQEWDEDTLEPNEDTALAPEAFCSNCDHWIICPYGIEFVTTAACHFCHTPIFEALDEPYRWDGHVYCDKDCAEAARK